MLTRILLAIPVFHAYGHKGECQVLMNPRRLEGFALTDGEQLERLWSYLRLFSKITKEQTPAHRLDLLSMALSHYSAMKLLNLELHLVDKLKKAKKTQQVAAEKTAELFLQYEEVTSQPNCREVLLARWQAEEKQLYAQKKIVQTKRTPWEEVYVKDLVQFYALRSQLQTNVLTVMATEGDVCHITRQIKRLEKKLQIVEKKRKMKRWLPGSDHMREQLRKLEDDQKRKLLFKMRLLAVEKEFLMGLLRKYAHGGQAVAIRLSKQLKRVSGSLKTSVKVYNGSGYSTHGLYPNTVNYSEMCKPSARVYGVVEEQTPCGTNVQAREVSSTFRRQMLDSSSLEQRAREEESRLCTEMRNTFHHYTSVHAKTLEWWCSLSPSTDYMPGLKSVCFAHLVEVEKHLQKVTHIFRDHVDLPPMPSLVTGQTWHDTGLHEPNDESDGEYTVDDGSDSDSENVSD